LAAPTEINRPPACTVAELALDYQGDGAGAGSDFGTIWIRDVAAQPCLLRGPVELTGIDRAGKAVTYTVTYPVHEGPALSPKAVRVPIGTTPAPGKVVGALLLSAEYRDDPSSLNGLCEQNRVVPAHWRLSLPGGALIVANSSHDPAFPAYSSLLTCRGELNTPSPIIVLELWVK